MHLLGASTVGARRCLTCLGRTGPGRPPDTHTSNPAQVPSSPPPLLSPSALSRAALSPIMRDFTNGLFKIPSKEERIAARAGASLNPIKLGEYRAWQERLCAALTCLCVRKQP